MTELTSVSMMSMSNVKWSDIAPIVKEIILGMIYISIKEVFVLLFVIKKILDKILLMCYNKYIKRRKEMIKMFEKFMDYLEYEVENFQKLLEDPRNNPFDSYWGTVQRCFGASTLFAFMNEENSDQIEDIYNETAEKIKEIYLYKIS